MSAAETKVRAAAFLDRDGVVNVDHGYLYRWSEFEFMPGAIAGMRELAELGYALVVITNQSGIGRGYYTESDFKALTAAMREYLLGEGVELAGVYFCPHHPEASIETYRKACSCRKPAPGMLHRAARDLGLDLPSSLLIGDKPSDIEAGLAAGVTRLFQLTDQSPVAGAQAVSSVAEMARALRSAALDPSSTSP